LTNNGQYKTTEDKLPEIMDNTPGKIHHVEDINGLVPLETPQISPQWFSMVSYTGYQQFQAISGTYAVSMTDTASGIIALQQAGGTLPEADFVDIKTSACKVASFLINYIFEYYDERRIFDVVDHEVPMEAVNLDTDIFVDFGDTLPDDKVSRVNLLTQLLQAGAINKAQFIEELDDPRLNKYYDEMLQEVQMQQQQLIKQQQYQDAMNQQNLQKTQQEIERPPVPVEKKAETRVTNERQEAGRRV